jgi:hypothetical protein
MAIVSIKQYGSSTALKESPRDERLRHFVKHFERCGGCVGAWAAEAEAIFVDSVHLGIKMARNGSKSPFASSVVVQLTVPEAWEGDMEKGPSSRLGRNLIQSLASKAVALRSMAKENGVEGWERGDIIDGLPCSSAPGVAADEPEARELFSASLSVAFEAAGADWLNQQQSMAALRAKTEAFLAKEAILDAAPFPRTPPMAQALEFFRAMDAEMSAGGSPPSDLDLAVARMVAMKACGLEGHADNDESPQMEPAWRALRVALLEASTEFGIPEHYLHAPSDATIPTALFRLRSAGVEGSRDEGLQYQWFKDGSFSSTLVQTFDNPLAMARWIVENDRGGGKWRMSHADFLRTPEGAHITTNNGFLGEWSRELISRFERAEIQMDMGSSTAPSRTKIGL